MSALEFRNLLEAGNLKGYRAYWAKNMPKDRQPRDDAEAEIAMHMARTKAESISLKARAYSHKWLIERDLESLLPDQLKPNAEQICPIVKESVGIIVGYRSPILQPAIPLIRDAMANVALDAMAEGDDDIIAIRKRMMDAKAREERLLFGNLSKVIPNRV